MIHRQFRTPRSAVLAASALMWGVLVAVGLPPAPAAAGERACIDEEGVTVVVDATDIGGSIVVNCAVGEQATGRAALEAAGFTPTDSTPGMICAIDAQPDPCPATFEGSYWAYWYATTDGQWTSYQVGADSSAPMVGDLEGWRYNDGSTPPGIAPAGISSAVVAPTVAESVTVPSPAVTAAETDALPPSESSDQLVLFAALGLAAVIAVLIAVFVIRSRRRTQ